MGDQALCTRLGQVKNTVQIDAQLMAPLGRSERTNLSHGNNRSVRYNQIRNPSRVSTAETQSSTLVHRQRRPVVTETTAQLLNPLQQPSASSGSRMSPTAMLAPSRAKSWAMAWPMAPSPPLIIAVLPSSFDMILWVLTCSLRLFVKRRRPREPDPAEPSWQSFESPETGKVRTLLLEDSIKEDG